MDLIKKSLLPLLLVVLVACSWANPLDSAATEKIDAGLKRALISFATARALNAVISVLQGTDVAVEPAGVGVNFAPGEALDPINDLIENFSNLMLAATISFGIQRVLITIGGHWLLSFALTAATLLWCAFYLRRKAIPSWITKCLVVTVLLRFAIPTVTVGTDVLFQNFLAKEYSASQSLIEANTNDAKKVAPQVSLPENAGFWDKMRNMSPQDLNPAGKIDRLLQAAEKWPEQIIRLMVVFLLETLIIPVSLLWLLLAVAKTSLRRPTLLPPPQIPATAPPRNITND